MFFARPTIVLYVLLSPRQQRSKETKNSSSGHGGRCLRRTIMIRILWRAANPRKLLDPLLPGFRRLAGDRGTLHLGLEDEALVLPL
jgi:hypothetical protein